MDGWITWECKSSYTSDFDEEIERWENRLHKVTTLNCDMMTWSLRYVSLEERNIPTYDGMNEVDTILDIFEREVSQKQCFQALD